MADKNRTIDVDEKLRELIEAGLEAYNILVFEVRKELDVEGELSDDKRRNAIKAKKECFMDAKEILSSIKKINDQLEGVEENKDSGDKLQEKDFSAGWIEQNAKKNG